MCPLHLFLLTSLNRWHKYSFSAFFVTGIKKNSDYYDTKWDYSIDITINIKTMTRERVKPEKQL